MMRRAQPWLGTIVEVGCINADENLMIHACNKAFESIEAIHERFSFQSKHSELTQFNQAPVAEQLTVSSSFAELLRLCLELNLHSEGYIEPCAGHSGCITDIELNIEDHTAIKKARLILDLSGIAKGYAVDRAIDTLVACGIACGWVNAGGDLRMFGSNVPKLHLRTPNLQKMTEEIWLQNVAVASSGNYLNPVVGVFNPKSEIALNSESAATVQASTCVIADALCKAALFLPSSHRIFKIYDAKVLWQS
jgi:FAD:protein FMN transferase